MARTYDVGRRKKKQITMHQIQLNHDHANNAAKHKFFTHLLAIEPVLRTFSSSFFASSGELLLLKL
jgi:hypothetical protein